MEHVQACRLGLSRYPTNIAAVVPTIDERIAWSAGDHAGAARMMRTRTGATWVEAMWVLIGAASRGGAA